MTKQTGVPEYRDSSALAREFPVGSRVQLHAATGDWMRGDRYGEVTGYGREKEYIEAGTGAVYRQRPVMVKLDKSKKVKRFHPANLFALDRSNPRKRNPDATNLAHFEKWNRGGRHKWITKAIAAKLPRIGTHANTPAEKVPVALKLFNPGGAGSWFITEANLDTGEAFGYADLGHGEGELGYMDLNEMRAFKGRFGLPLERDEHFSATLAEVMEGKKNPRKRKKNPDKSCPHCGAYATRCAIDEPRRRATVCGVTKKVLDRWPKKSRKKNPGRMPKMGAFGVANFGLHVHKVPSGKFAYVGSIPRQLGKEIEASTAAVMAGRAYKNADGKLVETKFPVFDTEAEAIAFAGSHGFKVEGKSNPGKRPSACRKQHPFLDYCAWCGWERKFPKGEDNREHLVQMQHQAYLSGDAEGYSHYSKALRKRARKKNPGSPAFVIALYMGTTNKRLTYDANRNRFTDNSKPSLYATQIAAKNRAEILLQNNKMLTAYRVTVEPATAAERGGVYGARPRRSNPRRKK